NNSKHDLLRYKGRLVVIIYNENPNSDYLTLKGVCIDASSDFIHIKSGGNITTSIKREWIRKIKDRGDAK
ncbi:hypothetical protein COV14_02430, partial [Candidatus Woesearchaeota archaeon CG10_big_fil_rev_8_21_14_0_10_33_12]